MFNHYGDAKEGVIHAARHLRHQVNLADQAINARALVRNYFEVLGEMVQFKLVELPLEVVGLVPLHHTIFDLADSTQIAVNLHDSVWVLVVTVLVVVKHCLLSRLRQLRDEPLHAVDVKQALHAEEIDGNLDDVTLAHLDYGLDQRS